MRARRLPVADRVDRDGESVVLVGREVTFADTAVVATTGSDHAPLVATVSVADAVEPVEEEDTGEETEEAASPSPSPSVSVSAE